MVDIVMFIVINPPTCYNQSEGGVRMKRQLKEHEIKAIRLYMENNGLSDKGLTSQQIAESCGWKHRSSLYDLLKRPEAKELMEEIATEATRDAINILKSNSRDAAKNLLKIARGEVDEKNKAYIYAVLNAITSVLNMSGITSKNIIQLENNTNKNNVTEEDILASIERVDKEEEQDYIN